MIQRCLKWQGDPILFEDNTNLYIALLVNERAYIYNRRNGWERRKDLEKVNEDGCWKTCTPLEVLVVCGVKGLK